MAPARYEGQWEVLYTAIALIGAATAGAVDFNIAVYALRFSLLRTKNLLISATAAGMTINGRMMSQSFGVSATVSNACCRNGT